MVINKFSLKATPRMSYFCGAFAAYSERTNKSGLNQGADPEPDLNLI